MWPRWRLPDAKGGVAKPGAVCDPLVNPARVRVRETEAGKAPSVLSRVPPLQGGLRQAPYKRGQGEHRLGRSPPTPKSLQLLPTSTHSTPSSTKTHLRSMPLPPCSLDDPRRGSQRFPSRPSLAAGSQGHEAWPSSTRKGEGRAGQPGEGADSAPAPPVECRKEQRRTEPGWWVGVPNREGPGIRRRRGSLTW